MAPRTRLARPLNAEVLNSLTGVTVVIVGLLYLAGILVTSAEIRESGVSVRDTLPLFGLDQLLSRGVSLVLPSLVVLGVAVLIAGSLRVWEDWVREKVRDFVGPQVEAGGPAPADSPGWGTEFESELAQGHWVNVLSRLKEAQTASEASGNTGRTAEISRLRSRVRAVHWTQGALLLVLAFVIPWFVPWVLSIACLAIVVAWVMLDVTIGARPVTTYLGVAYAILLVATLIQPWVDTRPLPTAVVATEVRTISSRGTGLFSGRLVLVVNGRWHIARAGSLHVIEPNRIRWSRVSYEGHRPVLIQIIDDEIHDLPFV